MRLSLRFGALAIGIACAFSGCATTTVPPPKVQPDVSGVGVVTGRIVRSGTGIAVPDATVALVYGADLRSTGPDAITTTSGPSGAFAFTDVKPGRYGVTATASGEPAGYGGVIEVGDTMVTVDDIAVGGTPITFTGNVRDEYGAAVPGALVSAVEFSPRDLTTYVTRADDAGAYEITLDAKYRYIGFVASPPRMRSSMLFEPGTPKRDFVLQPAPVTRPDDATLRAWLDAHAIPIATDDPAAKTDDLAPIAELVGDARFITIGEATHGSRELFRLRHRLFQSLVERAGVTVLAVELGYGAALPLDAYVQGGPGDPAALLHATVLDYIQTEEWRDLLVWMRAYNAEPTHTRKLHIVGFDVDSHASVPIVVETAKKLVPERAQDIDRAFGPLASYDADGTYAETPESERARCRDLIDELRKSFAFAPDAPALLHHLDILAQATRTYVDPFLRDGAMFENVKWIADGMPGERIVLSMHDAHASKRGFLDDRLGREIAAAFGAQSYVIGTGFGRGAFRSLGQDASKGIQRFSVDAPASDSLDAAMTLAAPPIFALDLRGADGPVGDWLDGPMPAWSIGFRFIDAPNATLPIIPKRTYDLLVFADEVDVARALERPRAK